jgi:stage IV sporulation protein B
MATQAKRRATACLVTLLMLLLCAAAPFRALVSIPDHVWLSQGETQNLRLQLPAGVTVHAGAVTPAFRGVSCLETGRYRVHLRLFGLIPLRRLAVDVVPPIRVIPGGHSIGVLLRSQGVMVVGHAAVRDPAGAIRHPGREAGIELGDIILSIGGIEVNSQDQVARLFEEAGQKGGGVTVTLRRKERLLERRLTPARDKDSGRFRAGLYIRDGAAGVGTLTFFDPASGKFGALGHVIADAETSQPILVRDGHIVGAVVTAIQKGRRGVPGEKIATFKDQRRRWGSIEKNSRFGVFGHLHTPVTNPLFPEPVPVALNGQVKEGPAEIVTVVEGQRLERFRIEIVRVARQRTSDGKNMIIRITDARLLDKTGGIVQGMSGSPILQEGRMVGAVTHVFVSDPTRGYGASIEWMLQEAGVLVPLQGADRREDCLPAFLQDP